MSPPGQRSGPRLDTWGAANVAEVATVTDSPVVRQPPRVRGVIVVNLAPYLDRNGFLADRARCAEGLGQVLPGIAVRVELGQARFVDAALVEHIAAATVDATFVDVVGARAQAVTDLVRGLEAAYSWQEAA